VPGFEGYAPYFNRVASALNPCDDPEGPQLSGPGWGEWRQQLCVVEAGCAEGEGVCMLLGGASRQQAYKAASLSSGSRLLTHTHTRLVPSLCPCRQCEHSGPQLVE
jgi:hypothetical protein